MYLCMDCTSMVQEEDKDKVQDKEPFPVRMWRTQESCFLESTQPNAPGWEKFCHLRLGWSRH